jgi:hypothetical protein
LQIVEHRLGLVIGDELLGRAMPKLGNRRMTKPKERPLPILRDVERGGDESRPAPAT